MVESTPTPDTPAGQSVNRREAAALLACSIQTVTRLIRAGRLRATDIGLGRLRHYRISLADLREFQANSVAPTPDAPIKRSAKRPTIAVPNLV
ncbi:MAG TPA: helix-turn-helix domain-containing protein [Tepidisphaeraceae bacterium]|jgi:excisionase family DNA binding protein|nr:helix-turn-helix domain-containing protein [Tepidisphaeraceae bacterium]